MKKYFLAALCAVSSIATAGVEDGKWGSAQVFDVQRSPATPVQGSSFTVSSMRAPYEFDGMSSIQYSIASNQYVAIVDTDPAIGTCSYQLLLKNSDDTTVRVLQQGGQIWGLGNEGFLHISDPGNYGTFFANSTGFNYGDSFTYTPDTSEATCAQVEAYTPNQTPLYIPSPPLISGTPKRRITLSTEFIFTPTVTDADTEVSALTFSVENKPDWMSFIEETGELYGVPSELGTYSKIKISVSDGTNTVSLAPFDVEVIDGSIDTSVSGGAVGMISILLGTILTAIRRRKYFAMPLLLAILPMKNSVAAENQNWYLGVGGGVAKVKPDVNVVDYERDKDSSPILLLNAGYCFTGKYCLDAKYTHVNNFEIAGSNDSVYLGYHVTSLGAKYTPFLQFDYFTPYIIAGASYFNVNSSSSLVETEQDVRFSYGIGAKIYESENISLLFDAMRHAKDLSSFTLSVQYTFSSENAENR